MNEPEPGSKQRRPWNREEVTVSPAEATFTLQPQSFTFILLRLKVPLNFTPAGT